MPRNGISPTVPTIAARTGTADRMKCPARNNAAHKVISPTAPMISPYRPDGTRSTANAIDSNRAAPDGVGTPDWLGRGAVRPRGRFTPRLRGVYTLCHGNRGQARIAAAVRGGAKPPRARDHAFSAAHDPRPERRARPLSGNLAARLPRLSATRFGAGPAAMVVSNRDQSLSQSRARQFQ